MIIAFENLFGKQYEGGSNWLEVSLQALGLLPDPPTCLVVGASQDLLPSGLRDASHVKAVPLSRDPQSTPKRLLKGLSRRLRREAGESPGLSAIGKRYNVDLWVGFCGFEGLGSHRKLLVWYPDFQHRYFPELFDSQELKDRDRQWNYVAERAHGLIAISQAVANDAVEGHPEISAKLHVCAFPPVISEALLRLNPDTVRSQYHLPEHFLLVCNQFWTHKNHLLVIQALAWLKENDYHPPVVAFTGRPHDYRNPDAFSQILRYVHSENLNENCRFLGVIPREEQLALIRAADAVIHPSRFEGRGAIVEETNLIGTQLLCSDLPVHRELNTDGTLFFHPDGVSELAHLMLQPYRRSAKGTAAVARESRARTVEYGKQLMNVCYSIVPSARMHKGENSSR